MTASLPTDIAAEPEQARCRQPALCDAVRRAAAGRGPRGRGERRASAADAAAALLVQMADRRRAAAARRISRAARRPMSSSRLKVLAELLTYRTDVPQEGRIRRRDERRRSVEMRVSTFPTLHGERAVVRLFAGERPLSAIWPIWGCRPRSKRRCCGLLNETSGAILLTGPAGSGKTTTAYACLREVVRASQRPAQRRHARRPDRSGAGRRQPVASAAGRRLHLPPACGR